jgi:hypothetical protein
MKRPRRSALQFELLKRVGRGFWLEDRWRLLRQRELEFMQQQRLIGFRLGVARHNQPSIVGGREPHIQHLDGSEFLKDRFRRQAGRMGL